MAVFFNSETMTFRKDCSSTSIRSILGGAVALDGRIEPGDMILQVNDISFENFTNDQAVDVLRESVARRG